MPTFQQMFKAMRHHPMFAKGFVLGYKEPRWSIDFAYGNLETETYPSPIYHNDNIL